MINNIIIVIIIFYTVCKPALHLFFGIDVLRFTHFEKTFKQEAKTKIQLQNYMFDNNRLLMQITSLACNLRNSKIEFERRMIHILIYLFLGKECYCSFNKKKEVGGGSYLSNLAAFQELSHSFKHASLLRPIF